MTNEPARPKIKVHVKLGGEVGSIPVRKEPAAGPDNDHFQTPEQIAAQDGKGPVNQAPLFEHHDVTSNQKKAGLRQLQAKWQHLGKKQRIALSAVAVLVVFGIGGGA